MFILDVEPGAYELLYNIVVEFVKQIPTVFRMLVTVPTAVNQLLALLLVFLSSTALFKFIDLIKIFFKWLNEKL